MKRRAILISLAGAVLLLTGCPNLFDSGGGNGGDDTVGVTGVTLDQTILAMVVGDTVDLTATVAPENASDKTVSWSSDNEDVATVSDSGTVTALAAGVATITVTTNDGGFSATSDLTVTTPTAGVAVDPDTLLLGIGETGTLTATVSPADADDKTVSWSSSDSAIATVDTDGVVAGVADGTATITVTTNDGGYTDQSNVTVDGTAPADVSDLSANSGNGEIDLTWTDPSDNDLNQIQITWSPAEGESQPKNVSPGTESAAITGLTNGTKYTFTVDAVDGSGNSSGGASVSAPPADISTLFSDASAGLTGVNYASSSLGDVDGDGDLDLVITGRDDAATNYTATLYTNDGTGAFTDASAGLTGVWTGSSSFGDVDDDGDLDLVVTGLVDAANGSTVLYTNDGNGTFSASTAGLDAVGFGSTGSFADVDDDGDLDLLITGSGSSETALLYTNDGNGNFTDAGAGLTGVYYSSSAFGDVDGDGDLDLVISGRDPFKTTILYTNDGSGNFADAAAGLANVEKGSTSFGDVDGDGDLDLVITGQGTANIAKLYLNDGDGNFTDASAGFTGVFDSAGAFADVDDDGDLDLAIIGETTGGAEVFYLYVNDGAGTFTEASTSFAGWKWGSLSFGDVDGDGDIDLVVAGIDQAFGGSQAILYENTLY